MNLSNTLTMIIGAARALLFAVTEEGEGVLNEIVLQPESYQI